MVVRIDIIQKYFRKVKEEYKTSVEEAVIPLREQQARDIGPLEEECREKVAKIRSKLEEEIKYILAPLEKKEEEQEAEIRKAIKPIEEEYERRQGMAWRILRNRDKLRRYKRGFADIKNRLSILNEGIKNSDIYRKLEGISEYIEENYGSWDLMEYGPKRTKGIQKYGPYKAILVDELEYLISRRMITEDFYNFLLETSVETIVKKFPEMFFRLRMSEKGINFRESMREAARKKDTCIAECLKESQEYLEAVAELKLKK